MSFRTKISGGPGERSIQKIWDPLFISVTVDATSNSVYKLGLGSSLPRNNLWDQNWQGSGLGEHPKKLGPPYFFVIFLAILDVSFAVNSCLNRSYIYI